MKRFLAVLMLVVMMCGCVGLAEEQKFDYTVLEKLDGYSYDKFEKAWSYYGAYVKHTLMRELCLEFALTVTRSRCRRCSCMQRQ